jgi:hypothetical protein
MSYSMPASVYCCQETESSVPQCHEVAEESAKRFRVDRMTICHQQGQFSSTAPVKNFYAIAAVGRFAGDA